MSQAGRRIMAGGVYQPRSRGAAMQDVLADARRAMARLLRRVIMRGAGLLLMLAGTVALLSLLTYSATDGSLNNATGVEPSNLFGGVGATAADILLQSFGRAAGGGRRPRRAGGGGAGRGRARK